MALQAPADRQAVRTQRLASCLRERLNRCLVLSVDADRKQIPGHPRAPARRRLLVARDRERITRLHHNAQRMLRPVLVVNPYVVRGNKVSFRGFNEGCRPEQRARGEAVRSVLLLSA